MKYLLLFVLLTGLLFSQSVTYKSGYQFPVFADDSVHSGLKSVRGSDYHPNPLGNGVAAFAVTNYNYDGFIHVFKNIGNDAMELVWTSPAFDSLGGGSYPRHVRWCDLDNDGTIELVALFNQNGLVIFEWDEVPDSWNFGTQPTKIIADPLFPTADSSTSFNATEYLEVADLDGDGEQELALANNSTSTAYDRFYIFSIQGQYSTGNPGFTSIKREGHWPRTGIYGLYGGGTPYCPVAANLDGAGLTEMIFFNWNYAAVNPVRTLDIDTYALADTTGGHHFIYTTYPTDATTLGGGTAFDIDDDGREEVYFPLYGSYSAHVVMVHYEPGDDLSMIDSSNFVLMDLSSVYPYSSFFGFAGYGDYDQDGNPNLYFAGSREYYITSAEFQGGDKTDLNNWTYEVLYDGDDLDTLVYSGMTITDSAGVVDTVFALQRDTEGTIAFKISAKYTDFDKDGYEDIIMPTQTWKDSIDITKYTWNGSSYDTTEYAILEPNRISIRFLESDVMSGFKAKDITFITPDDYKLRQNYPNPFNPETNIAFYLPIKKKISLIVYNELGQKVKTLIDNKVYNKGDHSLVWNGTNDAGQKVATGMYIYSLKYGNFQKSMKMMMIK